MENAVLRALRGGARRLRPTVRRLTSTRARKVAAIIGAAVVGGWLGLLFGAHVTTMVGPVDARMSVRPSLAGDTLIDIPPLGTVRFDTHDGPLQLDASVDQIRPEAARQIFRDPHSLSGLEDRVADSLRWGITKLALKSFGVAIGGAVVVSLIVFRRPRWALWSGSTAGGIIALSALVAFLTFNPRAIAEPRYTGLLTSAPSVVGSAQSIAERFSAYQEELAKLVTNVSRLYDVTSTLPVYEPSHQTIRVLHVSDLHLNPEAWDIMHSLVKQYQIDVIVDTGDSTDSGTKVENRFVSEISTFDVPYVWIKGNHDSMTTRKAVARQRNAVVLDGTVKTVDGIRFFGAGDPRFTPGKNAKQDIGDAALHAVGLQLADRLRTVKPPVDIAMTHDPVEARAFDGTVPLILAGHLHARQTKVLPRGSRLMVGGSTGGAGFRSLDHGPNQPTPVECSVLYISKDNHRLQAWDNITLGGLGITSARIERHTEQNPDRALKPPPSVSPSPTSSPTGTPSASAMSAGAPPNAGLFGSGPSP
ncbi:MAG: metallophosphoesterase family protein [Nocardioidaceae bacterium]